MVLFDDCLLVSSLIPAVLALHGGVASGLITDEVKAPNIAAASAGVAFPCGLYPGMCKPPFDCQDARLSDLGLRARRGHINVKSWCNIPDASNLHQALTTCLVDRDLKRSAHILYRQRVSQHMDELDASYCFAEGHCTNEAVTDSTTALETMKMCDDRFGHAGWAGDFMATDPLIALTAASFDFYGSKGAHVPVSLTDGIREQKISKLGVKLACARGTFHCDVQYCKHTYCKNLYYIRRYGHLSPTTPGAKIVDP